MFSNFQFDMVIIVVIWSVTFSEKLQKINIAFVKCLVIFNNGKST